MKKKDLKPGDSCFMKSNTGLKLRGIIADFILSPETRDGRDKLFPFQRKNSKKVKWIPRNLLHKLPAPTMMNSDGSIYDPRDTQQPRLSAKKAAIANVDAEVKAGLLTLQEGKDKLERLARGNWKMEVKPPKQINLT